jgi:hypothetical protein
VLSAAWSDADRSVSVLIWGVGDAASTSRKVFFAGNDFVEIEKSRAQKKQKPSADKRKSSGRVGRMGRASHLTPAHAENKSNAGMGTFYRSKHELVFVWKNGTASHINNFELGQFGRSRSNVWGYSGVKSSNSRSVHRSIDPI